MKLFSAVLFVVGFAATFVSMVKLPSIEPYRDALAWAGFGLASASQTGHLVPKKLMSMIRKPKKGSEKS